MPEPDEPNRASDAVLAELSRPSTALVSDERPMTPWDHIRSGRLRRSLVGVYEQASFVLDMFGNRQSSETVDAAAEASEPSTAAPAAPAVSTAARKAFKPSLAAIAAAAAIAKAEYLRSLRTLASLLGKVEQRSAAKIQHCWRQRSVAPPVAAPDPAPDPAAALPASDPAPAPAAAEAPQASRADKRAAMLQSLKQQNSAAFKKASAPGAAPAGALPPLAAKPAAAASSTPVREVVVPEGWQPGVHLATRLESGARLLISPPSDATPGMALEFDVPPDAGPPEGAVSSAAADSSIVVERTNAGGAKPTTREVIVPASWRPGVRLVTTLDDGVKLVITPPSNCTPGMAVEFDVPLRDKAATRKRRAEGWRQRRMRGFMRVVGVMAPGKRRNVASLGRENSSGLFRGSI